MHKYANKFTCVHTFDAVFRKSTPAFCFIYTLRRLAEPIWFRIRIFRYLRLYYSIEMRLAYA